MNSLDDVIKDFNALLKNYSKGSIQHSYYSAITKYLKLEHKYKEQVETAKKPIYHYFKYKLPSTFTFGFLYHPYNPVRFAVETFDSIEEIKQEL